MSRYHKWFLVLMIPYCLILSFYPYNFWMGEATSIVVAVAVFLSTPGLVIVGVLLCLEKRTKDKLLGVFSILLALLFFSYSLYGLITGI